MARVPSQVAQSGWSSSHAGQQTSRTVHVGERSLAIVGVMVGFYGEVRGELPFAVLWSA